MRFIDMEFCNAAAAYVTLRGCNEYHGWTMARIFYTLVFAP